jgi:hypothetical protein
MRVPHFSRTLREVGLSMSIRHRHLRDPDVRFLSAAFELTLLVKPGLWSSMTGLYKDEGPGVVNESRLVKSPTSRKVREKWGTLWLVIEKWATRLSESLQNL